MIRMHGSVWNTIAGFVTQVRRPPLPPKYISLVDRPLCSDLKASCGGGSETRSIRIRPAPADASRSCFGRQVTLKDGHVHHDSLYLGPATSALSYSGTATTTITRLPFAKLVFSPFHQQ